MRFWKIGKIDDTASIHLDAVRTLAALVVVVGHARKFFFQPYANLISPSYLDKIFYWLSGLGHQAVIVFFVLSGFFISASVIKSFQTERWSWWIYLLSRITRLWIVLLPALLLGTLWDRIGMRIGAAAALYNGPIPNLTLVGFAGNETVSKFFGNLFFLQGVLVPSFGSNVPLWSLSYEFWYYLLFPMMLCAYVSNRSLAVRCIFFGLSLLAMFFIGRVISLYYLIWLTGVIVLLTLSWRFVRTPRWRYLGFALTVPLFVGSLALVRVHRIQSEQAGDFLVAVAFVLWMLVLVQPGARKPSALYTQIARESASFSYTLYLTHFPLLLLLKAWISPQQSWVPNLGSYVYLALLTLTALLFAGVVGFFTERNTPFVRSRVLIWTRAAKA